MLENNAINFVIKHASTIIQISNMKCMTQSCDDHKISKMQSAKRHLHVWLCCCVQPISGILKERRGRSEVWINVAGRLQVTELSCCVHARLMHGCV